MRTDRSDPVAVACTGGEGRTALLGAAAALAWVLFAVRWFDPGAPWRPPWLAALPSSLLGALLALALGSWLVSRFRSARLSLAVPRLSWGLAFVVAVAVLFRLPLAWWGALGYLTPDGALSGTVALHLRDGVDHLVFVPHVPYSGSLKSHLAAALALLMDPARAFALASVAFYGAYVAGLYRLAERVTPSLPFVPVAAGLYAALAPPFVTHYSLSNDGNYVEVLAFGTWALVLAVDFLGGPVNRLGRALPIGLLLGLAFWAHILAIIPAAAVGITLFLATPRDTLRAAPRLLAGWGLGYLPGLLWNAGNHWESFLYLLPGVQPVGTLAEGPGPGRRLLGVVADQLPVLFGYDPGYGPAVDTALHGIAWVALLLTGWGFARLVVQGRAGHPGPRLLVVLVLVNLAVAWLALPYIPGNARYLLFLEMAAPIALAQVLEPLVLRPVLVLLVGTGMLASLAQGAPALRADQGWRAFVAGLEAASVRHCHTDFFLAAKINFASEERVVCSAKLGPTTTEYFFEYRRQAEQAPRAALVAVNATAADKLERRLQRLGVGYRRLDLMKPVLLPERRVDPAELFPDRDFPLR